MKIILYPVNKGINNETINYWDFINFYLKSHILY